LANFFAGTYVLSDGGFGMGDYIELQGGPAGYVIEVGWRSTKIRTWLNNLVVIPNSVMADSIVTNYSGPEHAINIMVTSGVSYDSDLQKVEEVSLEIGRKLIEDSADAVKTTDAFFGFDSFGDSNIGFWVFLQARDRWGSFVLTNELIKRLQSRFRAEDIEINYPVRKLVYDASAPPPPIPAATGV
jgi:small-conductance mechanosensitive channel